MAANRRRNYKKEYREYHGKPEQKRRRAARNRARYKAMKQGKVKKGDGKEVHHVKASRKGRLNNKRTKVISRAANRRKQPKRGGTSRTTRWRRRKGK